MKPGVIATAAIALGLARVTVGFAQEAPRAENFVDSYSALGEPHEEHAELAARAGEYDVVGRMRFTPDGPWEVFFAEASLEPILDGRFLAEHISGEQTESWSEPYEGLRLLGFDNLRQEYVYTVLNNFGTNMLSMSGPKNDSNRIDVSGPFDNPMTGSTQTWRTEYEFISSDRFVLREYPRDVEDREYIGIEATYTRRSSAALLVGRWRGTRETGETEETMTFDFGADGRVLWGVQTGQFEAEYSLRYWADYSTSPVRLELLGFVDGPLAGLSMFGIIEIDGDEARVDLEPGPAGSVGDEVRPKELTDQTLTMHRLSEQGTSS